MFLPRSLSVKPIQSFMREKEGAGAVYVFWTGGCSESGMIAFEWIEKHSHVSFGYCVCEAIVISSCTCSTGISPAKDKTRV